MVSEKIRKESFTFIDIKYLPSEIISDKSFLLFIICIIFVPNKIFEKVDTFVSIK